MRFGLEWHDYLKKVSLEESENPSFGKKSRNALAEKHSKE